MTLTRLQRLAVYRKYQQDKDGARTYREFRRRVVSATWDGGLVVLPWCGMYVGIETDGYAHP